MVIRVLYSCNRVDVATHIVYKAHQKQVCEAMVNAVLKWKIAFLSSASIPGNIQHLKFHQSKTIENAVLWFDMLLRMVGLDNNHSSKFQIS